MTGVLFLLLASAYGVSELQCAPCEDGNNKQRAVSPDEPEEDKIVDGKIDWNFRFKYAVALFIINPQRGDGYMCTGSIIGRRTVLTAAHCLRPSNGIHLTAEQIYGKVGSADKRLGRRINFIKDNVHPEFVRVQFVPYNDIAILITSEDITDSEAKKVCIAAKHTGMKQYRSATVIGWGRISRDYSKPQRPVLLRYASLKIRDLHRCKNISPSILTYKQICAGGGRKDTCKGDSGGPLSYTGNKKGDIVIGITSFGAPNACGMGDPGVYTRVAAYADWIIKAAGGDGRNVCLM